MMADGLGIPVLANGEIWNVEDYFACRARSGVADVALGRGLVRRPTLALEIRAALGASAPSPMDRHRFLTRFFAACMEWRGEAFSVARMKQILRYWSLGDEIAMSWFNEVKRMSHAVEVEGFLAEELWPKSRSTHGLTAPTAYSPRVS
jgi:tRNA-dihydrouridine synthase C